MLVLVLYRENGWEINDMFRRENCYYNNFIENKRKALKKLFRKRFTRKTDNNSCGSAGKPQKCQVTITSNSHERRQTNGKWPHNCHPEKGGKGEERIGIWAEK